jgi:hypothetical protein
MKGVRATGDTLPTRPSIAPHLPRIFATSLGFIPSMRYPSHGGDITDEGDSHPKEGCGTPFRSSCLEGDPDSLYFAGDQMSHCQRVQGRTTQIEAR